MAMDTGSKRALTEELGEVIRTLSNCQQAVASLAGEMTGIDTRVRLLLEGKLVLAEPAAALAPVPVGAPGWFAAIWPELVAAIDAQVEAAGAGQPGGAAQAAAAQRYAERLAPLRTLFRRLAPLLAALAAEPDYRAACGRFEALAAGVEPLLGEAAGAGQPAAARWTSGWEAPEGAAADLVQVSLKGGVPTVNLAGLARVLERALDAQLALHFAPLAASEQQPEPAPPERLEADLLGWLEALLDLRHSLTESARARGERGAAVLANAAAAAEQIKAALGALGLEEIEVAAGEEPVNLRKHEVMHYESDSRWSQGTVVRVVIPGYRYGGEIRRKAQVVVAS